jgi:hypothetical protein
MGSREATTSAISGPAMRAPRKMLVMQGEKSRMGARFTLEGIYTPVITPFLADGEIDFDALADLVDRLVAAGVHGLISGGSTGEN